MIEQDTIKLLRECDAGVKMGVASIDDVLEYVDAGDLKKLLSHCKDEHIELGDETAAFGCVSRRRQGSESDGKKHVVDENKYEACHARIGRDDRRSDDGRLQYGREVAQQISESVQGCR